MKLLIPQALAPLLEPRLAEIAPDLSVVRFDDQGEPDGDISDATIMVRWWTPVSVLRKMLATAPGLRWIHTPALGVWIQRNPGAGASLVRRTLTGVHQRSIIVASLMSPSGSP